VLHLTGAMVEQTIRYALGRLQGKILLVDQPDQSGVDQLPHQSRLLDADIVLERCQGRPTDAGGCLDVPQTSAPVEAGPRAEIGVDQRQSPIQRRGRQATEHEV
jgi:hypothetical protein